MTAERYVLKHFYYGQLVQDGKASENFQLLAQTHGLTEQTIKEAIEIAPLPPMPNSNEGSWGLIRGKAAVPFVLVESERTAAGSLMRHYVILPADLMRLIGGNLRLLHPFIAGDMPEYAQPGNIINPLILADITSPDETQEVDDILEFMMFTKNKLNVIESLLSVVVHGVPIVVTNAPDIPAERELFITGLLTLLPPSVRFAVTFAIYSESFSAFDVQVRFLDSDTVPDNALIYDWSSGEVSGQTVKDEYSRFIVSQLRLDIELVVRQTRALTSIANWRMRQTTSRLVDALGYAAHRVTIDDAVQNQQPVEAADVAKILANDPTLSDELRLAYAQHLMSFSIAIGELDHAEPLGIMLGSNADLADTAYQMLEQALHHGAAGDIFDLMTHWLSNPMGPQGIRWVDFTHHCAKVYLNDIINTGDIDEVELFLKDVDRAGAAVGAEQLLPDLLGLAMPVAVMNDKLTNTVFILGCKHLTYTKLLNILGNTAFLQHLPDSLNLFVKAVAAKRQAPNILLAAASAFDHSQRLIMIRLVEIAMQQGLPGLVDGNTLKQLVKLALADWGTTYDTTIAQVVAVLSSEQQLRARPEEDGRYLLEILLASGSYEELTRRMLEQSRLLYVGDRQTEFAVMVGKVFAETPIQEEEVPAALQALIDGGIRSLPLVLAYIGSLDSHNPSEIMNVIADDATIMLEDNPKLLDVLPMDGMTSLLQFHFKRRKEDMLLRAVYLLPVVAARYGMRTLNVIGKIYQRLGYNENTKTARLEMLRRYIRFLPKDETPNAIIGLTKGLGKDVKPALDAAHIIKLMMDNHNIETYAHMLGVLRKFLHDPAQAYSGKGVPSEGAILNDLDSMPGGLSREDKLMMAEEIVSAGRAAYELGDQHRGIRGGDSERRIESLLIGETDPASAVEIMRVMSGYLANGTHYPLPLSSNPNPHPLPRRSTTMIKEEIDTAHYILQSIAEALPGKQTADAAAIRAEMASIWNELPQDLQASLRESLAQNLQYIAELITIITHKTDLRVLEDSGIGRRLESNRARPRNVLEFFRFVAGYYLTRA